MILPPAENRRIPVALLASGRGSNVRAILQASKEGKLPFAEIKLILSNVPEAKVLEVAREFGIATAVVDHKAFGSDRAAHDAAVARALRAQGIQLVVLAGYMRLLTDGFVNEFAERMINVHPSLLPSFPGVGAQRQAILAGVRVSGCTVHYVTAKMDAGPIILQKTVPILPNDNEESLTARILAEEHKALPQTIDLLTRDRVRVIGGRVAISPGETSFPDLEESIHATTPLLLATGNSGKIQEIRAILDGIPLHFFTTAAYDRYPEPEETGTSYLDNARIKAEYWNRISGLWSLADDSGIEVDALGGRPGIFSSRYAPSPRERIDKMLTELQGVPAHERTARFIAAVVLISPGGEEFSATGICEGRIALTRCGANGFGYDPIFIPEGYGRTHLAEMPDVLKNEISHRGKALEQLKPKLRNLC